jgi:putative membrane protein
MRRALPLAACLASFASLALAQQPQQPRQPADQTSPPRGTTSFEPPSGVHKEPLVAHTFVARAGIADMTEIELSELALARSKDPAVQAYARKMIDEHRKALGNLKTAASEAKVSVPGTLDQKHEEKKAALSRLQGKDFDKEYAQLMAAGHDQAVALYDAAASAEKLPEVLQRYAKRTLPVIRTHRDAAHELHEKEGI